MADDLKEAIEAVSRAAGEVRQGPNWDRGFREGPWWPIGDYSAAARNDGQVVTVVMQLNDSPWSAVQIGYPGGECLVHVTARPGEALERILQRATDSAQERSHGFHSPKDS